LLVALERARFELGRHRLQPPLLPVRERDVSVRREQPGMLPLLDLVSEQVLGRLPGRRRGAVADAGGVSVVHDPDVALCPPAPPDAGYGYG
jgi:hypothetical protein